MADINQLIGLANQMGLVFGNFDKSVSNATKCGTWEDVQASHRRDVLSLSNIYGTLALLMVGLTGSLIILILEGCLFCISSKNMKNSAHQVALRS